MIDQVKRLQRLNESTKNNLTKVLAVPSNINMMEKLTTAEQCSKRCIECILQLVFAGTTSHLSTSEPGRPITTVKMGFSLKLCLVLAICSLHCQVSYSKSVIPRTKLIMFDIPFCDFPDLEPGVLWLTYNNNCTGTRVQACTNIYSLYLKIRN